MTLRRRQDKRSLFIRSVIACKYISDFSPEPTRPINWYPEAERQHRQPALPRSMKAALQQPLFPRLADTYSMLMVRGSTMGDHSRCCPRTNHKDARDAKVAKDGSLEDHFLLVIASSAPLR
ncbi:MAG: hypothetical protein AUK55_07795 [Syntrophobacteraceae bacterium CG2_30_61_12]|nr:MAG: hypothetical protein AUK55_07795 [Syntrophobacteraceae bacterium CG2_30_61_12]